MRDRPQLRLDCVVLGLQDAPLGFAHGPRPLAASYAEAVQLEYVGCAPASHLAPDRSQSLVLVAAESFHDNDSFFCKICFYAVFWCGVSHQAQEVILLVSQDLTFFAGASEQGSLRLIAVLHPQSL
jgi:hypothetical protein